jgi:hypothetical protein
LQFERNKFVDSHKSALNLSIRVLDFEFSAQFADLMVNISIVSRSRSTGPAAPIALKRSA